VSSAHCKPLLPLLNGHLDGNEVIVIMIATTAAARPKLPHDYHPLRKLRARPDVAEDALEGWLHRSKIEKRCVDIVRSR
jgi:hypothetical protein